MAIEAVGGPASFELAVSLARPGGRIANIGVHGQAATLHLEEQWIRDITITTGLVDTSSTPTLMRLVTTGQIDAKRFITHHFGLDEFDEAYDVFARAAATRALKVVLSRCEGVRTMKTAVKDVMTTRVIWVRKDAPFRELAAALRRHRVSAFPVLGEDDKVIGVVSEADMLTKEALDASRVFSGILHHRDAEKARGITAGDLMTARW